MTQIPGLPFPPDTVFEPVRTPLLLVPNEGCVRPPHADASNGIVRNVGARLGYSVFSETGGLP